MCDKKTVMRKALSVMGFGEKRFQMKLIVHYALRITAFLLFIHYSLFTGVAFAEELNLQALIEEALKSSPEILASESKALAYKFRIPQSKSLPDPMFMFGYQNEGTRDLYTFGDEMAVGSQWMFSLSQMFPFPGKLNVREKMAASDAESQAAASDVIKLKTILRIKELYYDLLLAYKNIDLIKERTKLFSMIEDASIARYSSGMAPQQEVIMAQTEKYMLIEREEMEKQRIQSLEAMLNSAVGRDVNSPLGRPADLPRTVFPYSLDELIKLSNENSPDIKAREKMVSAAEAGVHMAKLEYYPDFTINASYFARSASFPDMWSLTTAINIPLFYKTKQRQAVNEAKASLSEAQYELEAFKLMLSSAIRDNYSMFKTAEKLMELYKEGLIPKAYQDFESALSGYVTGRIEAITVITRLKSLIEFEALYLWQLSLREKAIARIKAIAGIKSQESEVKSQELKK